MIDQEATGAPAYELYLWPHSGLRTAIARGLKAINHRPRKALDHGFDFDWQVVAVLRDGVTQEGPVWTFRTMPALFKRGDPNSDRSPNLTDAIYALAYFYLGGKEPDCLESLDVNGDGSTNITDVIGLLNYIFLGGDTPEEPFSSCGVEEAGMPLGCKSFFPCDL